MESLLQAAVIYEGDGGAEPEALGDMQQDLLKDFIRGRRRNRSGRGSGRLIEGYITARSLPACHKRESPARAGRAEAQRPAATKRNRNRFDFRSTNRRMDFPG